jgi:hypothetical protein
MLRKMALGIMESIVLIIDVIAIISLTYVDVIMVIATDAVGHHAAMKLKLIIALAVLEMINTVYLN